MLFASDNFLSIFYFKYILVFSREVLYFPLVLILVDVFNVGEGICQSFDNHSFLLGMRRVS